VEFELYEYEDKQVRITDVNFKVWVGFVDMYTSELDDPNGIETISIIPNGTTGRTVSFAETDISAIEVLETLELATENRQLQPA